MKADMWHPAATHSFKTVHAQWCEARCGVVGGGVREMVGDSVAGGISFCLYPNCDHKTVNGATRKHSGIQTAAWERSIWLLHHWAEGALSKAE